MSQLGLVHLIHQLLNLVRSHRHTAQHTHFQSDAQQEHTKPARTRHDTPPSAAQMPHKRSPSGDNCYASAATIGGARESRMAASETGWSSQRNALRRMIVTATAGHTSQSGTRTAMPNAEATPGRTPATMTTAMQRTATVLRVRRLTGRLFYRISPFGLAERVFTFNS